jgi:hypothetical protein
MPKFIIQREYLLPVYQYEAGTFEEARAEAAAVAELPCRASAAGVQPEGLGAHQEGLAPRPFDHFLAAQILGRKSDEPDKFAIAVAPLETAPQKWESLPWIFEASAQPVPFGELDAEGWCWRFVTIGDILRGYVRAHPTDFLDAGGAPAVVLRVLGTAAGSPFRDRSWAYDSQRIADGLPIAAALSRP